MPPKRKKSGKKKKSTNRTKYYLIIAMAILVWSSYYLSLNPNINTQADYSYFYIPPNATTASVLDSLTAKKLLKSKFTFSLMAQLMKYQKPSSGLYQVHKNWGNFWLLNNLKNGNDNHWTSYQIIAYSSRKNTIKNICKQFDIDADDFEQLLEDESFISEAFNLNTESIYSIFLPGSYKTYKTRTTQELLHDIYNEYQLFWNNERRERAKELKLSTEEVVTLASIVYAETKRMEEMPVIAGLYLNRLNKDMPLQADPTLVFAKKQSGIRRVYFKDMQIPSPYNTYLNKGLPPGPIGPAPLQAIEAVLNAASHNYFFFCAMEDQSGCHYFSENFEEHKVYASRYRSMLNKRKIK